MVIPVVEMIRALSVPRIIILDAQMLPVPPVQRHYLALGVLLINRTARL